MAALKEYRKHIVGQSLYEPEKHIPLMLEMMKDGRTVSQICVELEIADRTFYQWLDLYEDFRQAYELGKTYKQAWWENLARDGATGNAKINANLTTFMMKAHFKDTYSPQQNVNITQVNVDLTEGEILKRIKNKLTSHPELIEMIKDPEVLRQIGGINVYEGEVIEAEEST
jgi:hypothetical protein